MNSNKFQSYLRNNFVTRYLKRNYSILIALIVMGMILTVISSSFFTSSNLWSVLRQASINTLLALAMAMVLIIGCIDLSVSSVLALSGALGVIMINNGIPVSIAMLLALGFGVVSGSLNGFLVAFTQIPPFIITLATQQCFRGAAYLVTNGRTIMCYEPAFTNLGSGNILGLPIPVLIVVLVLALVAMMLGKAKFGRRMYAVGGNKSAATYSGINVQRITVVVYILTGVLSALAGIVLASRTYSCQPTAGEGYECDAIAAAVLGGVSFTGGVGTAGGVLIGSLIIAFLNNGLNMLHVQSYWQTIAKGIVILIAVYFDTLKTDRLGRGMRIVKKNNKPNV